MLKIKCYYNRIITTIFYYCIFISFIISCRSIYRSIILPIVEKKI